MSLLKIVKSVMDSNGWPTVTSSVSASQDQNMRQCMALANKALENTSYSKNWVCLTREHTFDTVDGQSEYPLPIDFHHLVAPSAVDATSYYELKGAQTPIQWYRNLLNGNGQWYTGFRIDPFLKMFRITPTPTSIRTLMFMYVTKYIAMDSDGVPITQYTQDGDESVVDEGLVELDLTWRWRQKKGLDFTAEMAEYNGNVTQAYAQELAYGEVPIGGRGYGSILTQPTVPPVFGV